MRNARTTLLITTLAVAIWGAGCSSDDPAEPMDGLAHVSPVEAEEYAVIALGMVNDMATDVPEMATGSFATAKSLGAAGEPDWDAEQQAWVLDYSQQFSEGDPAVAWGETTIHVWVQFRNTEGPLPTALGATVCEYRAVSGMTMHTQSEEGSGNLAYDLATTMIVAYVDGGYTVVGTGGSTVEADFTDGQRSENVRVTMEWNADLALMAGSCPTGTADVTVGQYRLDAVYDGSSTAQWTFTGPDYHATGTEPLECGAVGMPVDLW
ncbi:MAG: hypothetical protein GY838_12235 [bacterium]|nr:hypothetical protein [bacterium]